VGWETLWIILNLALLGLVFARYIWPHLASLAHSYERSVTESLTGAEEAVDAARRLRARNDEILAGSHDEAQDIVSRAKDLARRRLDQGEAEARREGERIVAWAKESIHRRRDEAIRQLRHDVSHTLLDAVGAALRETADGADHERVLSAFIQEVSQ